MTDPQAGGGPITVNVFGAGISGLTVAHELAERGFRVRVIERDASLDRHGHAGIAVGGVARTQYGVAPAAAGADRAPPGRACASGRDDAGIAALRAVSEVRRRRMIPLHIPFEPGSDRLADPDVDGLLGKLRLLVDFLRDREVDCRISVTGYGDADDDVSPQGPLDNPEQLRELCVKRAERVKALLSELSEKDDRAAPPPPLPACVLAAARQGERAPRLGDGATPTHNRWALVDVSFTILPGEHGFRFFPSYYSHVFDTMRRIPILDQDGNETGRTVYDNVVPTPNQGIVHGGQSPVVMPRSPPESDHERRERLRVLSQMGYTATDLMQLMLRVTRYMSTCSRRRAKELERISWWEYLEGYDPDTGSRLYRYSERFERDTKTQSRVLASFDAVWGDARTVGNTYVQLLYNWLRALPKVDGTLNAPTSEAWLGPWKAYLERRLGVQFVLGELESLELVDGELEPRFHLVTLTGQSREELAGLASEIKRADYHVIATDACAAEQVTRSLARSGGAAGVVRDLGGFTTKVRSGPSAGGEEVDRPEGHYGVEDWDRLQVMSGIQYFFTRELKINNGYVYFNHAPWGLTSINSAQFWQRRPTLERDGFVSLLSVDLCDFRTKAREGELAGRTAWSCTSAEIAKEVWDQIVREMRPVDASWGQSHAPPAPDWYHIDENVLFGEDGRPSRMLTPYLVPIKADFSRRPGPRPWDPTPSIVSVPGAQATEDPDALWQAPHGGYPVHWKKLVFAGVYLKTFTRMSTMEAANESARHAVNAILDHVVARRAGAQVQPSEARPPAAVPSEEARHMRSEVFYRSTPLGDYCKIWDPEHGELPELVWAKQYDEQCFDKDLPHPWDILGIERIPSLVSRMAATAGAAGDGRPPFLVGLPMNISLEDLLGPYVRMAYPLGGGEAVLQMLRGLRKAFEDAMKRDAPKTDPAG